MWGESCELQATEFEKERIRVETEEGRPDLKIVSAETLAELIQSAGSKPYLIVDARFPYEYAGGHIRGAVCAPLSSDLQRHLSCLSRDCLIVFHCEFSEYRAPSLCRWLRSEDRRSNQENFPHLSHPHLYLLRGGYSDFYSQFPSLCEPQSYTGMKEEQWKRERKDGMERVRKDRGRIAKLM